MSESSIYRWNEGALQLLDHDEEGHPAVAVADSWLVTDGAVLALELHRQRFAVVAGRHAGLDVDGFWTAVVGAVPDEGDWFPRVELHLRGGSARLVFRLRVAPERSRSVRLATHRGPDPRTTPTVKGPDSVAMLRARTEARLRGADDAVILSPDGFVVEGAHSALLWWRGAVLCGPAAELQRVDSVTVRSVLAVATALGVDYYPESVSPAELDGCEIWSLSALHGIRIVTDWVDGPSPAEEPGRLATWRRRLDRLTRPLPG